MKAKYFWVAVSALSKDDLNDSDRQLKYSKDIVARKKVFEHLISALSKLKDTYVETDFNHVSIYVSPLTEDEHNIVNLTKSSIVE
jgi:hypothetical protein